MHVQWHWLDQYSGLSELRTYDSYNACSCFCFCCVSGEDFVSLGFSLWLSSCFCFCVFFVLFFKRSFFRLFLLAFFGLSSAFPPSFPILALSCSCFQFIWKREQGRKRGKKV